jgi:hypothetical protein
MWHAGEARENSPHHAARRSPTAPAENPATVWHAGGASWRAADSALPATARTATTRGPARSLLHESPVQRSDRTGTQKASAVLPRLHGALVSIEETSLLMGEILELEPASLRQHRVRHASQLLAEAGELLRVLIRESREVQTPHAVRRRA